ncbi:MAG: 1-acyl-sn-glycerol-3-phosphate acyltransferase [Saprospiraceae bacterium]
MFYKFLKILVGFTLRVFFRKIYISGIEHVQHSKAQLIASNHPNGFLEPLLMACFFPKDLHFLVRGDVFDNPFLKPILRSTHQIPIFRFRDGFSKLRENSQTMDESYQVLLEHKNLLIFAEGGTESIKKLRPLQKGIARIGFQVLEKKSDLEIEILPVGINFTYPSLFNAEVMLKVGKPIDIKAHFSTYTQDKNTGYQFLLDELYQSMQSNVIHLENQERVVTFENLLSLKRMEYATNILPVLNESDERLLAEKKMANVVDALPDEKLVLINDAIKNLSNDAKAASITLQDIRKKSADFISYAVLIVGLVPAVLGFMTHGLPISIGYIFTKTKVKAKEFRASILMVSVMVMILLWYILLIIIGVSYHLPWYCLVVVPLSGLWARYYYTYQSELVFVSHQKLQVLKEKASIILSSL